MVSAWNYDDLFRPRKTVALNQVKLNEALLTQPLPRQTRQSIFPDVPRVENVPYSAISLLRQAHPRPVPLDVTQVADCRASLNVPALVDAFSDPSKAAELVAAVQAEPFNPHLLRDFSCFLQSLVISHAPKGVGAPTAVIGKGVNGVVMRGIFPDPMTPVFFPLDRPPAFIVKTSIDKKNDEDVFNELFTGMYINSLRAHIAQFMYVYGGYRCAPAVVQGSEVTPCAGRGEVHYSMLESITATAPDAEGFYLGEVQTMADWVQERAHEPVAVGVVRVINVLCQVFLALAVAQVKLKGFSHDDLHLKNILIRRMSAARTFAFPIGAKTVYQVSEWLVTIIDYGRVCTNIEVNTTEGKVVRETGALIPRIGTVPGRPCTLNDIGRVLTNALDILRYSKCPWTGQVLGFVMPLLSEPVTKEKIQHFSDVLLAPWIEAHGVAPFNIDIRVSEYLDAVGKIFVPAATGMYDTPTDLPPLFSCGKTCDPEVLTTLAQRQP